MTFFVDTSALYALMGTDHPNHAAAWTLWRGVADTARSAVTHDHVVLGSRALVHRQRGIQTLQDLVEVLLLPVTTVFVDEEFHRAALPGVLNARLRDVSPVDMLSFEVMRRPGIGTGFAFDSNSGRHGFTTLPERVIQAPTPGGEPATAQPRDPGLRTPDAVGALSWVKPVGAGMFGRAGSGPERRMTRFGR